MIINDKRALAYIQHVTNIRPIEGADNIEQCNVLGWNLICKKGEFHEVILVFTLRLIPRFLSERSLNSFAQRVLRSRQ